jgi:hypothetical protein
MNPVVQKISDSAPIATYGGGAASVAFWGLQVNEICAIISTIVAVIGLALQIYVSWHRMRRSKALDKH